MPDFIKDIVIGGTTVPIAPGKIVYGTTPTVATISGVTPLEITGIISGTITTATYNIIIAEVN